MHLIVQSQTSALHHITKEFVFYKHFLGAVTFEALRMLVLPVLPSTAEELPSTADLLTPDAIAMLNQTHKVASMGAAPPRRQHNQDSSVMLRDGILEPGL